jgi:hypothetical protein
MKNLSDNMNIVDTMVEKIKKAVKKRAPKMVAYVPIDKKTKKLVTKSEGNRLEAMKEVIASAPVPEYFEGKLVISKEVVVKGDKKYWDILVENGIVFREPYE